MRYTMWRTDPEVTGARENIMSKSITITKGPKVQAPAGEYIDIVAFQVCAFEISFFGTVIKSQHDTKIMQDGSQFVIGGDGFIPHGYKVA